MRSRFERQLLIAVLYARRRLPYRVPGPQGNTNQVNALQEEVTLAMPLPTLKALFLHLQMIVKAVETEIGPIRIIQSMRATDANFEIVKQGLKSNPLVTAE
jgi:hypothetical protein